MFDREIDRTIDEVAREMTAGEPADDLRARVVARIDARRHLRYQQWPPRVIAVAAALIAAVATGVIAMMLLRGQKMIDRARSPAAFAPPPLRRDSPELARSSGERRRERTAPQQQAAAPQQQTAASELRNVEPAFQAGRRGAEMRAQRHQVQGDASTDPGEVAALAPPPLEVESIALGELAPPPPLEVEQLEPIAPIAVAPLGEGDRP